MAGSASSVLPNAPLALMLVTNKSNDILAIEDISLELFSLCRDPLHTWLHMTFCIQDSRPNSLIIHGLGHQQRVRRMDAFSYFCSGRDNITPPLAPI